MLRSGQVRTFDGGAVYTGAWSVIRGKLHMISEHGSRSADLSGFERSPSALARLLLSGVASEVRPRRSANRASGGEAAASH